MAIRYLASLGGLAGRASRSGPSSGQNLAELTLNDGDSVHLAGAHLALPAGYGVIVGHLFSKAGNYPRIERVDAEMADAIVRSAGEVLVSEYWGGYVLISQRPDRQGWCIVRDPSGTLPCYFLPDGDRLLIASDVDLLCDIAETRPPVDWPALARHLRAMDLRRPETCLVGVRELLAGHRLMTAGDDINTTCVWSPWDYTSLAGYSHSEAATRVREATDGCIDAWGRCFDRIGISLSGGLDSSIVAAGMRHQAEKVSLVNMATDEAEGDERHYAKLVAEGLGKGLTERFYAMEDVDVTKAASAHLPRPVFSSLTQAEIGIKQRLEADIGLDVFFAGHGGDNVFCNMQSATPALDRLRAQGLTPGVLATLDDICELTGCSIWEAVSQLAPKLLRASSRYRWHLEEQLLNPDAHTPAELVCHPWLDAPTGALPGKAVHVAMLTRIQGTIDGFSRHLAGQINPLLSQPVMETCLGIPTWQWIEGGINRSVARHAFANVLPDRIVQRRSKGGPGRFAFQILETHRSTFRDLMVEGLLARHGLVDVPALQAAFDADRPIDTRLYVRLMLLAEAETWARHWSGK